MPAEHDDYMPNGRRLGRIQGHLDDIEALLDLYTASERLDITVYHQLVKTLQAVRDAQHHLSMAVSLINTERS